MSVGLATAMLFDKWWVYKNMNSEEKSQENKMSLEAKVVTQNDAWCVAGAQLVLVKPDVVVHTYNLSY